ncbi:MAG: hypothetical protein NC906_07325 [Candidatus Omnitrophica bacterium]|nr:hypothetical protein [Candidatus Omnitrophota bacterium]
MSIRDRILCVYNGKKPDCVPFVLDLSHWFYHHYRRAWDLTMPYHKPDIDLIDIHKKFKAGFYVPILNIGWRAVYPADVRYSVWKENFNGIPSIVWEYETPFGKIRRRRIWEEKSYSWPIVDWAVKDKQGIEILQYALSKREFFPEFDSYNEWNNAVGDIGIVYMPFGYSAMGMLLNLWMGVEGTIYAICDMESAVVEFVEAVNENNLKLVDLLCESPAEVILMGDNFSADIQSPRFFERWSKSFYCEAIKRFHKAGKKVAVHIDGRLRGCLRMITETKADCGDAITPLPAGDLSPMDCRIEAGDDFILSGGISPTLWLGEVNQKKFERAVVEWLSTKDKSFRLMAAAGDQVPPGAEISRIILMREMVNHYGRF